MRILVTGAAGFIGSHVCDLLLSRGHSVVGMDDLSTGRPSNLQAATGQTAFVFVRADVRGQELADVVGEHRPHIVMHLAAQSGVRPSLEDPRFDASVNIDGLLNVLECSAGAGVTKLVFASSGGTIYGSPRNPPVSEESRLRAHPLSPYGISKKVAEDYLRFYRRTRTLDFTALALGNVYGPRQDPGGEAGVISIFGAKLLSGEAPTIFGEGRQTRDYVYVDDVSAAFLAAIDAGSGLLLNVGSGQETSVTDLFRILAELTDFTGEPTYGPLPVGEVMRISLDVRRARAVLGWAPRVTLHEGLERTLASLPLDERASAHAP
jgi:UDP-glucose 4-epimerase